MKAVRFLSLLIFGLLIFGFWGRDGQAQKGKPKPPPTTIGSPAIAYSFPRAKQWDLMVMDADGSNPTAIVSQSLTDNTEPDWSPDGTSLVFSRLERKTGAGNTCIVKLSSPNILGCLGRATSSRPAWSPVKFGADPKTQQYKIALTSLVVKDDGTRQSDLFLVNEDGTDLTQLTDTARYENDVDWSPTGDRLAVAHTVTSKSFK